MKCRWCVAEVVELRGSVEEGDWDSEGPDVSFPEVILLPEAALEGNANRCSEALWIPWEDNLNELPEIAGGIEDTAGNVEEATVEGIEEAR